MQVKDVVINIDENREMSEIQEENVQTNFVGESSSNGHHSSEISDIKGENVQTNFVGESSSNAQSSLKDKDKSSKYKKKKFSLLILILVERLGLILIPTLLLTLTLPFLRNKDLWEVSLWKWEVLILFLVSGRLLLRCIIRIIIVFWIQRKFDLEIILLYYVYALKKTIQNCLWLLLLLAWPLWFHKPLHGDLFKYLEKTLFCSCLAPTLWLLITLIAEILTNHFYLGKIEESIVNHSLINMLSGPRMIEIQTAKAQEEEKLMNEIEYGDGLTFNLLHKLNPKFVSSLEMKSLMKTFTYKALDLEDEHSAFVATEKEAKAATEQIFKNIAGSRSIDIEDLMPFLIETQAAEVVNHFKRISYSGKLSQTALKNWILNVFRERRTLILRINDPRSPVPKLYNLLNFLAVLVIFLISILILEMVTAKTLVVIGSQFMLVAYIYNNTMTTGFEGIVFVFKVHPYDVGDRCVIDDTELVVEEINLLDTVFISFEQQLITIPNSELSKKVILNHNHTPDLEEPLQFYIDASTHNDKVLMLKQRIMDYMDRKPDQWYPSPTITMDYLEKLGKVKVVVWPTLRMNFVGMRERGIRRSMLTEELMKILRDLDISYLKLLEINDTAF